MRTTHKRSESEEKTSIVLVTQRGQNEFAESHEMCFELIRTEIKTNRNWTVQRKK